MYGMFVLYAIFSEMQPLFENFFDSAKKDKKLVFAVTVWYSVDTNR